MLENSTLKLCCSHAPPPGTAINQSAQWSQDTHIHTQLAYMYVHTPYILYTRATKHESVPARTHIHTHIHLQTTYRPNHIDRWSLLSLIQTPICNKQSWLLSPVLLYNRSNNGYKSTKCSTTRRKASLKFLKTEKPCQMFYSETALFCSGDQWWKWDATALYSQAALLLTKYTIDNMGLIYDISPKHGAAYKCIFKTFK